MMPHCYLLACQITKENFAVLRHAAYQSVWIGDILILLYWFWNKLTSIDEGSFSRDVNVALMSLVFKKDKDPADCSSCRLLSFGKYRSGQLRSDWIKNLG